MATKLFVGGLSFNTTEEDLKTAFGQAGTVLSAIIIMDRATNRSKGFGFVEFDSADEAKAAIDLWNGKELGGRSVTVNEARPMEPRSSSPRRDRY